MAPDTRPRALKIRDAVSAESEVWDRATKRRADLEYALEQFMESKEWEEMPDDERSKRYEEMSAAVNKAREEEKAGERAWRAARERAEKKIPQ